MFDKNSVKLLSVKLSIPLYLYDSESKNMLSINGDNEVASQAPSWLIALVESGSSRKLFQKNGETLVYHCFKVSNNEYLIFQDKQDQYKLSEFVFNIVSMVNDKSNENADSSEAEEYKRMLIKAKEVQGELRQEIRKRDAVLNGHKEKFVKISQDLVDLQNKVKESATTIKELNEANFSNIQQIRRMKSDTDYTNFQKLKQVNAELREEVNKLSYNSAQSGDKSGKIRKALEDTITMLKNQIEQGNIDKGELSRMVTGLSTADLGLTLPISKMPTFQDPIAQLTANQHVTAMPKFQDTMNADVHIDQLTKFKDKDSEVRVDQISQFQGEKGGPTQIDQLSQVDASILKNRDEIENLSEVEERVLRERQEIEELSKVTDKALGKPTASTVPTFLKPPVVPQKSSAPRTIDVGGARIATFDDIVNILNDAIDRNDATNINIELLSKVVPMSNKEAVAKYPAAGLRTVKSALIGLSRANKISGIQMGILKNALGLKQ